MGLIRAPPSKMREPYSNHCVCLSVRLSTLRCNAITQTVFDLETSYFIHRWRIKKEDTYRFWGQKVKGQGHSDMPYSGGQGHSDMPYSGALSDCVSFLVSNCFLKKTMHCYDWLKLIIGLNSGKTSELSHWDRKSISVFGVGRFRFRQVIYCMNI